MKKVFSEKNVLMNVLEYDFKVALRINFQVRMRL